MNQIVEIDYEAYGAPDHKGIFEQDKLQKALDWTLNTFEKIIIFEESEPDVPVIVFLSFIVTENNKNKRLFNYPIGSQITYSLKAEIFAKLYMAIILDDRIKYDKDADLADKASDKISCIIAFDKHYYIGHEKYIQMVRERGII